MLPAPTLVYQCPNCKNLITNLSLMSGNTKHAKMYSDGKMIAPMYPEFPDLTKCKKCDTIFWLSDLKEIGSYSDEDFLYHVSNIFRNYHNDLYDLETFECDEEKSEEEEEEEEEENTGSEEDELQEYDTFNYEEEEYKEETEESKWYKADKAKFVNITDSFRAISLGLAKKKREEIFIRIRIWWAYNDRVRNGKKMFIVENDEDRWRENCLKLIKLLKKQFRRNKILIADLYRNLGDFENCLKYINKIKPKRKDVDLILIQEKYRSECKKKNTLVFRLY